jgi:hypothetical protein
MEDAGIVATYTYGVQIWIDRDWCWSPLSPQGPGGYEYDKILRVWV